MEKRLLTEDMVRMFCEQLVSEEKSAATVEKYLRDVKTFMDRTRGEEVSKEMLIEYKNHLIASGYAVSSINSMLSSLNSLFAFLGWSDLRIKTIKIQRQIFCAENRMLTRAEFERLCKAAESSGDERLLLILQTICGTGIRVSELKYVTVEALREGAATVYSKSKVRTVFFVRALRKKLLRYVGKLGIKAGPVFITRTGNPISRVNVWRAMKALCDEAGVDPRKVFPHNLRHLFARSFYKLEKDMARLADILGHSSVETTRIYIISTGVEHQRTMERMHLIL